MAVGWRQLAAADQVPVHLLYATDAVARPEAFGPYTVELARDAPLPDAAMPVAVIGHSLGAYTALAVAGGKPVALPDQTAERVARPIEVEPDPRVRTLVRLAPAVPWLMAPDALADIRARVYARTAERVELAQEPIGFDRTADQAVMASEIAAFLRS